MNDQMMVLSIVNNIITYEQHREHRFANNINYAIACLANHINTLVCSDCPNYSVSVVVKRRMIFARHIASYILCPAHIQYPHAHIVDMQLYLKNELKNMYTMKSLFMRIVQHLLSIDTVLLQYLFTDNFTTLNSYGITLPTNIISSQLNILSFEDVLWDLHDQIVKLYNIKITKKMKA